MRSQSPANLSGWLLLPLSTLALAWAASSAVSAVGEQGYSLLPPSVNALASIGDAFLRAGLLFLGVALLVLWPLRQWGGEVWGPLRLARVWSALVVVGLWAHQGLHFNRYEVGTLWRERAEIAGTRVPRALLDPQTWAVNVGLTVGAVVLAGLLYLILSRILPGLAPYRAPRGWRIAGWLLLLPVLVGAALPHLPLRPNPPRPVDVVVISLDALRVDRLAAYGGDPELTPHLNRLAEDAVVFERAYCQEPWTLTSHMSMFTGLYPGVHGLDFGRRLEPSVPTLAEILRDRGWRTLASVYDCLFLEPRFGYGDGFDHYRVDGSAARDRARDLARRMLSGGPALAFLHLYDPHSDRGSLPYESAPAFRQRWAPDAAELFQGWAGPGGASETLARVNEGERSLSAEQREALVRLYDAGVAETDAGVGVFLESLRQAGRYEDALIVVLADHGEALGETAAGRPHYMHEQLMEPTLRIPLLVKLPGGEGAGERRPEIVETVDLLPTLLEILQLPAPGVIQGRSAWPAGPSRDFAFHRSGEDFAITGLGGGLLRYRWDPGRGVQVEAPADSTARALYDRWASDLAALHRANAVLADRLRGEDVTLSEADEELLRSLGYVQ